MQKKVAVERGLSNVNQALQDAGYQVYNLINNKIPDDIDCVIVTGNSENMLGIQNVFTKAPVINVKGLTTQEVMEKIEKNEIH